MSEYAKVTSVYGLGLVIGLVIGAILWNVYEWAEGVNVPLW